MMQRTWLWLLMAVLAALATACSSGGDDDDNDNGAPDDDDAADDDVTDDDQTDDDAVDDDTTDDDVTDDDTVDDDTAEEWPGPPWFGCTDEDEPGDATVVLAFDNVTQYWVSGDDRRTIDEAVEFPAGDWSQVTMRVELDCPEGGACDPWDRSAEIFLVNDPGTVDEEVLELWRYITPYGRGMCMLGDLTAYKNLLAGTQTIRSTIDTWVGPNQGWATTIKFVFHPAKDENTPDQIINLWSYFGNVELGNPLNPIPTQLGELSPVLPATVSRAELRILTTGHGQGNLSNCGEFCELDQQALVNGEAFWLNPWRGDCVHNPNGPGQSGTWTYNRNGWCPGAPVVPQVIDVTDAVVAGAANDFKYDIWKNEGVAYENTCRPGAGDPSNYCEGCAFDQNPGNCDYNGGNHTTPIDILSVQLYVWE